MIYTNEQLNSMSGKELHAIMKANGYICYGASRNKAALIESILQWQAQRIAIARVAIVEQYAGNGEIEKEWRENNGIKGTAKMRSM